MKELHRRLADLDKEGSAYELDYVVMSTGYVYRNAAVLRHTEEAIFISTERHPETYLKVMDIVSANIVHL